MNILNIFKKKKIEIDYDAETPRSLSSKEFKLILNKYGSKLKCDYTYEAPITIFTYSYNNIVFLSMADDMPISHAISYILSQNLRLLDQEDLFDLPENINLSQSDLFQ